MNWTVMEMNHQFSIVPNWNGDFTTVDIMKMHQLCVQVCATSM